MIVTYATTITARCPVDDTVDVYEFTLTLDEDWRAVEEILSTIGDLTREPVYQEVLTQRLQAALGGVVTTVGVHSGVRTTAVA